MIYHSLQCSAKLDYTLLDLTTLYCTELQYTKIDFTVLHHTMLYGIQSSGTEPMGERLGGLARRLRPTPRATALLQDPGWNYAML